MPTANFFFLINALLVVYLLNHTPVDHYGLGMDAVLHAMVLSGTHHRNKYLNMEKLGWVKPPIVPLYEIPLIPIIITH